VNALATDAPTVIIVGPPWPHSGTARLIQNQIEFYRGRGYSTLFLCVPIHCSFTETYPEWEEIKAGMQDLGADRIFFAPIDYRRFERTKYTAWLGHAFRGTALDWIVFTANSAELPDDAVRLIRDLRVDLIHVNHIFTLGFARRLRRQVVRSANRVPMILETHDIQADLLKDRREINPWTHRADTLAQLLRSEISLLNKAKVLVHCSVDDFNFFKPRLPQKPHVLALPTIDESFVSIVKAASPSSDPIDLLFVGQSTDPNRAGMKWFFEEVWPLIVDRGYRMKIVGKIDMLMRKEQPEIYQAFSSHFVGPSTELAPYYRAARCVFAPMVSGTGISIKTVEALALGKPFVGTSKAYRGLPMNRIEQAGLQAHDTPRGFADAIVHAISNERQAAVVSRAAYESIFSKQAAFASRDEAFKIATTK
jgi:glycosyltransferase involved in cell wall biosynthesis